jgi:ribosomal protein S14
MDRHNLWISMDKLKRHFFIKNELKRNILKSIKNSKSYSYTKRYQSSYHLTTLPKISSRTKSVNRCAVSGRVWSVNKNTSYNRFIFRTESYKSNIPGCRRASW